MANIPVFTRFICKISTHARFLPSTQYKWEAPMAKNVYIPLNTFVSRPTAVAHVSTSLASTTASSIKSTFGRRGDEGLQMILSALPALPPCFEQAPWPIDHIHHEPAKNDIDKQWTCFKFKSALYTITNFRTWFNGQFQMLCPQQGLIVWAKCSAWKVPSCTKTQRHQTNLCPWWRMPKCKHQLPEGAGDSSTPDRKPSKPIQLQTSPEFSKN